MSKQGQKTLDIQITGSSALYGRGRDCMVAGLTTTSVISAYRH